MLSKLIYPEHLCQGLAVEESKGVVITTSLLKENIEYENHV